MTPKAAAAPLTRSFATASIGFLASTTALCAFMLAMSTL